MLLGADVGGPYTVAALIIAGGGGGAGPGAQARPAAAVQAPGQGGAAGGPLDRPAVRPPRRRAGTDRHHVRESLLRLGQRDRDSDPDHEGDPREGADRQPGGRRGREPRRWGRGAVEAMTQPARVCLNV